MKRPTFYHHDSAILSAAWESLAGHPTNATRQDPFAAYNPETNEVWQYMGNSETPDGAEVLEFRHRSHPALGGSRVYAQVTAENPRIVQYAVRQYRDSPIVAIVTISAPARPRIGSVEVVGDSPAFWSDFGGAFDGHTVTSDADPGL